MCFPDCPRKEIYFMALIDILTHYGMKKRTARGSQIRKARRQRRNLHRQTRTVRKAVHGVYYQSTRVVVN